MPPRIVVLKQLDQLGARFLAQVAWWHAFGAGRLNLVNAAVGHVPTIGIGLEHYGALMIPAALLMMGMVADFFQKSVGVGVAVTIRSAVLTNVRPARNHVKGVRNHAGGQKRLTVGIEIEAPGIAGSFRKN